MKNLTRLLAGLLALTFVLIVWGAVVRTSGSGLGCPDWPFCYGQVIPPLRWDAWIEYIHRLLASLVGIGMLVAALLVFRNREARRLLGVWAAAGFFLILVQAGLGAVTVRSELEPLVVATHLGLALIFWTLLFLMFLRLKDPRRREHFRRTGNYHLAHAVLFLVFAQILLGGWVAASEAGLACPDFPTCQGAWIPSLHGNVALQFWHRVGALAVLTGILMLSWRLWRHRYARYLLGLVLLQWGLGMAAVWTGLLLPLRLLHHVVAVLLFIFLVYAVHDQRRLSATR